MSEISHFHLDRGRALAILLFFVVAGVPLLAWFGLRVRVPQVEPDRGVSIAALVVSPDAWPGPMAW